MDQKKIILNSLPDMRKKIREEAEQDAYQRQETQQPHNSYEFTSRLVEAVMENRMDDVLEAILPLTPLAADQLQSDWLPGRLADDPVRNVKNLHMTSIVNICNILAQGDAVLYESVNTVGDAGVRMLERAETPDEMLVVALATVQELVLQFGDRGEMQGYHPLVRKAKDYIFQRLHGKIVIGDMAKQLGTSPSYLSQLFRKYEGCTVQEFILRERLTRGKRLLALTDRSVQDISHSLGFSTESYFGKCLKEDCGLTPREYRAKYNDNYRLSIPRE